MEGGPLPSIQAILGLSGMYRGGGEATFLSGSHALTGCAPASPATAPSAPPAPSAPRATTGRTRHMEIYQDLPRLWITRNLVPINWTSPEKDIPSKCRETNTGSLTNKTENMHTRLVVPSMVFACSASWGEVGFHLWGPLTNPGLPLYNVHIAAIKCEPLIGQGDETL